MNLFTLLPDKFCGNPFQDFIILTSNHLLLFYCFFCFPYSISASDLWNDEIIH